MSWTARRRERRGGVLYRCRAGVLLYGPRTIAQARAKYLSKKKKAGNKRPRIIPRPDHIVSRSDISKSALKVLYRLKRSGYQAFLVGGGVRDLLLGLHPKDFDIATDAHPGQVRDLFRNCRLIGRRFRLAHIHFGPEIVEVATFRGSTGNNDGSHKTDAAGRILRDNVYGTIEEDVWRRDFTANALYYNIDDFSLWDFVGGVDDINARVMRLIGDPEVRYREDPVRMLRAVRFAAKLGFEIAEESERPLPKFGPLLAEVPPARLFEEVLKLFMKGSALRCYELLRRYDLFRFLFPQTEQGLLESAEYERLIQKALANTDERVNEDKPVTAVFLFAVMLWHPIVRRAEALAEEERLGRIASLHMATGQIAQEQQAHVSLPRRLVAPMREIVSLQPRFENRQRVRVNRLLNHPRFRAAYDLLLLRAEAGEVDKELATWWTRRQGNGGGRQAQDQKKKQDGATGFRRGRGRRGRGPARGPRKDPR